MKVFNILYVYGYGSSGNSKTYRNLKKNLPSDRFNVLSFDYRQEDPKLALEDINNYIKTHNIDLVIGSSLGGYLTLNLREIPKIVLNPCLHPEDALQLPILNVPNYIIDNYKNYIEDNKVWDGFDSEEKICTIALMGTHDELFGTKYKKEISNHIKWVYDVNQGHGSTEETVKNNLVPYILKWFDEISINVNRYFRESIHI